MTAPSMEETGQPATSARVRPLFVLGVGIVALLVAVAPVPLAPRAHGTLTILVAAAGLWMTEAVPLAWTALLIPVLAVLLRVADSRTAFAGFGDPILFLFFGTFLLTTASFDHGLNDRLAAAVLQARIVRRRPGRLLWAVALLGCGISAWVNNTATTVILLPLALAAETRVPRPVLVATLLMAAYAPSLGGLSTPVGTAPNLIGLRLLQEGTGTRISFAHWCAVFAPLAVVSTLLAAGFFELATRRGKKRGQAAAENPAGAGKPVGAVAEKPAGAGKPVGAAAGDRVPPAPTARAWSRAEKTLVPVFLLVVALWITPGILQATRFRDAAWFAEWGARLPETSVPLLGGLALFLLPSGTGRTRILDVGVLRRVDWSTLLLFGGGLSLGGLMLDTGLARAIGEILFGAMPIHGPTGIILASTLLGILVSEVTSNTASASLIVPIVLSLAQVAAVDPVKPALAATAACSFGFMLPVSTPPNALVYATGRVRISEMIRYGILLDLAGAVLITLWVDRVA
jgi:solute carrier family 13 (sodium-dependent dicarboxylate transporter), member 2/3/5